MAFDYFYGPQAEQFAFYRIPKVLFTDGRFGNISTDAKTLYGILLDRMNLSAANGWLDQAGRVYIIFTVEEIMIALSCGNKKAVSLLAELEQKAGLIERKRQGLGKPNLIYVKNFTGVYVDKSVDNYVDSYSQKCQRTLLKVSKDHFRKCQNDTEIILILKRLTVMILIISLLSGRREGIAREWNFAEAMKSIFGNSWDMRIWFRNIPMRQKALKRYLDFWLIPAVRPGR